MPAGTVRPRASQVSKVLGNPDHPYNHGPRGVWLLARRPTDRPYPCRCRPGCGQKCDCRGRTDLAGLPTSCCAVRAADTANRATTQPDTGETP